MDAQPDVRPGPSAGVRAPEPSAPSPAPGPWPLAPAVVALAAALGWSYAASFAELLRRWASDPNYSHGYLVGPIALAILWRRRARLVPARLAPSPWGWAALLGLLALRAVLYERNEQWIEMVTIPPVIAALALALGGWHLLGWALPAIAFLGFLLPLPPRVNLLLAYPLQRLATVVSVAGLQALGLPTLAEGNVIFVGSDPLEVARACNGLSMLLSFLTLITATTLLVPMPRWEQVVLLISAVPIALVSNVLRIIATALCYFWFGARAMEQYAHDPAGYAMMPLALALIFLELRLLRWLVVEEEIDDAPLPVLQAVGSRQ
jgi:exosortase